MATFERQIDALGGAAHSGSVYDQAHHDGYSAALDLAIPIGAAADTLIADLLLTLHQYVNDLRYPPQGDSVGRRIAAAEAVIAKATVA